ncbi:MAG: histone deacetylase family protein [Candidatus Baldrarchaeia archaeon]
MGKVAVIWNDRYPEEGHVVLRGRLRPAFEYLKETGLLNDPSVVLYEPVPASPEIVRKIHTEDHLKKVSVTGYYDIAMLTAGGAALAGKLVYSGEVDSAFVFTAAAGHHANKDFFWGFCYINNAAVLIETLRSEMSARRFMIVDTDPHFGDGNFDIYRDDDEVFLLEFHSGGPYDPDLGKTAVSVPLPHNTTDEQIVWALNELLPPLAKRHKPEMILWELGHDAHHRDYGGFELTVNGFIGLCHTIKDVAEKVCGGRMVVLLSGGSNPDVAKLVIYGVVATLAGKDVGTLPDVGELKIREKDRDFAWSVVRENVEKVFRYFKEK